MKVYRFLVIDRPFYAGLNLSYLDCNKNIDEKEKHMKLKEIGVENYRGLEELEYHPEHKVAVMQGPIGTGKSSVINAICQTIHGNLNRNDIRFGCNTAILHLLVEGASGDVSITRRIHKEKANQLRINHRNSKITEGNCFIEDTIGMSLDDFSIASSKEVLENLSPDDFGDFILQHIPEKVTLKKIMEQAKTLSDATKNVILSTFGGDFSKEITIPDIKEACATAKSENLLTKREMKRLQALIASYKKPEKLRALESIQKEMKDVLAAEAKYLAFMKQQETIKNMVLSRDQIKKELEGKVIVKSEYPAKAYLDYATKFRDAREQYVTQKNLNGQTIQMLTESLEKMNTNFCPLHQNIRCNTDKSQVKQHLEISLANLKQQVVVVTQKIQELDVKIQKYEDEYQKLIKQEQLNAWIFMKQEELKKAEQFLASQKTEEVLKQDFVSQKESLLNEEKDWKAFEEYSKNVDLLSNLETKKKNYNEAISFLDMDGALIAYVTKYYLGIFNQTVEESTKALGLDFEIKFALNDGITYHVKRKKNGGFIPYEQLSTGEKNIIAILILDLLNRLTGIRILFMDDLNDLDAKSFEGLMRLIMHPDFQNEYDHIFLGLVDHEDMKEILQKYSNDLDFIF